MTSFTELLQQGAHNAWFFIPSAILLGALHGLEPGHSKTMMAAFIVAVRGTVMQAVLLGLSATLSHTLVVWLIALGGLYFGQRWDAATSEPYLQVASAVIMIGIALWMVWRTWSYQRHGHDHSHSHSHDHHHDDSKTIDTGHGVVTLDVFEDGVPPRFRLVAESGRNWSAGDVSLETVRPDGTRQMFAFVQEPGFLESIDEIPEPHAFRANLTLGHSGHAHVFKVQFEQYDHDPEVQDGSVAADYADAHEQEHAEDIRRRFANRDVTTGQIILFGLTGGLIPCPASITVLLLCLQLKRIALGATLVLCFSVGLALTMVASGVLAALSVKHVSRRWKGFGGFANKAPYLSGALIILVALYVGYSGLKALA
jgi:nickel/cobalt exporter